jgi:arginase
MDVELLLVPYDTARRGWRSGAGPEHLVHADLPAHLESRGHRVARIELIEDDRAESPAEIRTAFEPMRRVAAAVRTARTDGRLPVVLSGNCNAAVGVLSGLTPADRSIFWFDAHGESNTPDTTASGFLDGMGSPLRWGGAGRPWLPPYPAFSRPCRRRHFSSVYGTSILRRRSCCRNRG